MPLIASRAALELALALAQRPDGARLAELAEATRRPLTTIQKAVSILVDDGVVDRERSRRPRYRGRPDTHLLEPILDLAARQLPAARVMEVTLRANPAVEFAARDRRGYIVVESAQAEPAHRIALDEALARVARARPLPAVTRYEHDALARQLRDDRSPRRRASRATILRGSAPRSFPDREHRTSRRAHPLGRPHPALQRIPRRVLDVIARRYGLRRLALFGSAVRDDFRPGSDVDVLVEPRPDARVSLFDLVALEDDLERLFGRDVETVTPRGLREAVRERAEREAVTIYG